jgi:hypothetical protein
MVEEEDWETIVKLLSSRKRGFKLFLGLQHRGERYKMYISIKVLYENVMLFLSRKDVVTGIV